MVQVFGSLEIIHVKSGSAIFVLLLALLVALECLFRELKTLADRHGYNNILEKLKKELTLLGIISFIVFVYQSVAGKRDVQTLLAFETAHIIILFIGIAFIIQAVGLVHYAVIGGRRLLAATRKSFAHLEREYMAIDANRSSFQYKAFHYFPTWLPLYPQCRHDIEYRIIEKFFVEHHSLPNGFRFSKYATALFKVCL